MSITGDGTDIDRRRLIELLSAERLTSYMHATGDDVEAAFALYEWNMRAGASVTMTTGMVEVIVRNALDRSLREWATERGSESWLDLAPLDQRGAEDIVKARTRATRNGRDPEVHGKVVAELTFGFWRYLVASRYLTALWIPALTSAFAYGAEDVGLRRRQVESDIKRLMLVRNRAAHHEPIFRRDLTQDHAAALQIASWIDPVAARWIDHESDLRGVHAVKPLPRN